MRRSHRLVHRPVQSIDHWGLTGKLMFGNLRIYHHWQEHGAEACVVVAADAITTLGCSSVPGIAPIARGRQNFSVMYQSHLRGRTGHCEHNGHNMDRCHCPGSACMHTHTWLSNARLNTATRAVFATISKADSVLLKGPWLLGPSWRWERGSAFCSHASHETRPS